MTLKSFRFFTAPLLFLFNINDYYSFSATFSSWIHVGSSTSEWISWFTHYDPIKEVNDSWLCYFYGSNLLFTLLKLTSYEFKSILLFRYLMTIAEQNLLINWRKHTFQIWWIPLSFYAAATGIFKADEPLIAFNLKNFLVKLRISAYSLDGDNLRSCLNYKLTFTKGNRQDNIRRSAKDAKLFSDRGHITICSFVSPFSEYCFLAHMIH